MHKISSIGPTSKKFTFALQPKKRQGQPNLHLERRQREFRAVKEDGRDLSVHGDWRQEEPSIYVCEDGITVYGRGRQRMDIFRGRGNPRVVGGIGNIYYESPLDIERGNIIVLGNIFSDSATREVKEEIWPILEENGSIGEGLGYLWLGPLHIELVGLRMGMGKVDFEKEHLTKGPFENKIAQHWNTQETSERTLSQRLDKLQEWAQTTLFQNSRFKDLVTGHISNMRSSTSVIANVLYESFRKVCALETQEIPALCNVSPQNFIGKAQLTGQILQEIMRKIGVNQLRPAAGFELLSRVEDLAAGMMFRGDQPCCPSQPELDAIHSLLGSVSVIFPNAK